MTHEPITCLNGAFMAAGAATVPLADRGFRFGDGVFETIRLHRGVPYQWDLHLQRLHAGLAALFITPPFDAATLAQCAKTVIARNNATDGFLRIAVSRGTGSRGYVPDAECRATWAIEYLPPVDPPAAPHRLWLSDIAKIPAQCLPNGHKLAQGVNSILAALHARAQDCDDALQLSIHGHVSETSGANIFWIRGGEIFTPSLETNCLKGTTRDAIIRLAPDPIQQVAAPLESLQTAEAMFITNARLGLHPVARIMPLDWSFDPHNQLINKLKILLGADMDRAAQCHAVQWSAT